MSTPAPVLRSALALIPMVAGNEDFYTHVVDGDRLRGWVGVGWVNEGMATDEHRVLYPTVIED